jgi:hypothetical protein
MRPFSVQCDVRSHAGRLTRYSSVSAQLSPRRRDQANQALDDLIAILLE